MERPLDIYELTPIIDRLVTCGGARVTNGWRQLLVDVGVAECESKNEWVWPTQHFLRDALPAQDENDLVRRVVIRDPQYRLHVDLCMCNVIHSVAIAERWTRLEELVLGACKPLMPRVAQLLIWWSQKQGRPLRELVGTDWELASRSCDDPAFQGWDRHLWGENRGIADLFPLLLDLYIPLVAHPCHIANSDSINAPLLTSLIGAAQDGEGLILSSDLQSDIDAIQDLGLPVRCDRRANGSLTASLVGEIVFAADATDLVGEPCDLRAGIPAAARNSCLVNANTAAPRWSIHSTTTISVIAPISVDHDAQRWPDDSVADAPEWLSLPGSDVLATAAKRRTDSPDADIALSKLGSHPLYGFLLQVLLLEALDRELGEETLALALPQNRKLETAEDWAETKILYRPREQLEETEDGELDGFLVLGPIDEVIPRIAHEVGVLGVATPYKTSNLPWSRAIYLMSTAGIVDGRPDRWILTITTFILDRLHSGSLMKDVIRGGRAIREQIHDVLTTLWKEQTQIPETEQIPA